MKRALLGIILAFGTFASPALAAAPIFDGVFAYTNGNNNCSLPGVSFLAVYRPQVGGVGNNTGLIVFQDRSGVGFARNSDGQFSGNGTFVGTRLSGTATLNPLAGNFSITQTPANVKQTTQSVDLEGTFTPTEGCRYIFKATFIRRAGT